MFSAMLVVLRVCDFIFFKDTARSQIHTLSLHDALPIYSCGATCGGFTNEYGRPIIGSFAPGRAGSARRANCPRPEEHTSERQSPDHLVCRLLLEKKNNNQGCIVIGVCSMGMLLSTMCRM